MRAIIRACYNMLQPVMTMIRDKAGVPSEFQSLRRIRDAGFTPKTIVDIGAFKGEWTKEVLKIFPSAEVLMVEAMEGKRPFLESVLAAHKNVSLEIAVLGPKDNETVQFAEIETASSVLEEVVTKHSRVERKTAKLDTVLAKHNIKNVDLLKLDVQGYELEVLKGMSENLAQCKVIQCEISLLDIHIGVPSFKEVIDFMDNNGFVVYDICSTSTRRPLDHALWQTDLLFVKKDSPLRSDKRYS